MSRTEAIQTLRAAVATIPDAAPVVAAPATAPVAGKPSLTERMAQVHVPNVGAGAPPAREMNLADRILAAGRKARGEA